MGLFSDDTDYLANRAERQLELAQQSEDPTVVAAHYAIANAYLDRMADIETAAE